MMITFNGEKINANRITMSMDDIMARSDRQPLTWNPPPAMRILQPRRRPWPAKWRGVRRGPLWDSIAVGWVAIKIEQGIRATCTIGTTRIMPPESPK